MHHDTGNFPDAVALALQARDSHIATGFTRGQADAAISLARTYSAMKDPDESIRWFSEARRLFEELNENRLIALARLGLANELVVQSQLEEAVEEFKAIRPLFVDGVDDPQIASLAGDLCDALILVDRLDEARAELATMDATPDVPASTIIKREFMRSRLQEADGDMEGAMASLNLSLETAEASNNRYTLVTIHERFRDLARARGDLEAYIHHSETAKLIEDDVRGVQTQRAIASRAKQHELDKERASAEQHRALLHSTLPAHIADRLINGEDVSGDHHDNATVLFLDVVGFTKQSSSMHPQQTTALLARIFHRFDEICDTNGITKIKTIGDSYMAVGFAEAGAVAATAMAMQSYELAWPDGSPVQFRIGLHTGPVVAGVIGSKRLQYDVWGDTVNTASRMESTGEPGRIQCSEAFVSVPHFVAG